MKVQFYKKTTPHFVVQNFCQCHAVCRLSIKLALKEALINVKKKWEKLR